MTRNRTVVVATTVATLAASGRRAGPRHRAAQRRAAGAFTVLDVRVPTETDNADTTKVELQVPSGFTEASYQAGAGLEGSVIKKKLATPIKSDDGHDHRGGRRRSWTGSEEPGQDRAR